MKPVYLEFNGINSFSDKAEIDFRTLLSGGVFGIFGDTGSGKSTILDCIHLALYGQIERSSGSECINHRLDSAYVVFDFEITTDGVRHAYRVRRERRRKNNTAKAWLYEYTPTGELAALAEGTRDVNERLEEIIGLTFADFKMCIALPQGDFAALVEAPTSERVKLVSRLFDLEKYGERLSKAVNEKYYNAENAVNLLLAKMEQNAGGSAENIAAKTAELAEAKERLVEQERLLKDAEKAHEQAVALDKEKREYDKTLEILRGLSLRLPEMTEKQKSAERLPLAKAVVREGLAIEKNDREKGLATMRAQDAETKIVALTKSLAQAKTQQSEAAYDEEIVKLSITLEKVLGAQADVEAEAAAKKRLEDCVAEYRRLQKECPWEDFEEKRGEIEAQLQKLGEDETLLDYMKRHFKDVLLPETYAEVRKDLSGLSEKYPETAQDVALLIKKYTLEKGVEETDVSKIQIAFKAAEQERKRLKAELDGLEKRKRAYDTNEEKKKLLSEQGKIYRESYMAAQEKTAAVKALGDKDTLKRQLEKLQAEKTAAQKRIEDLQEGLNACRAEKEKQNGLISLCEKQAAGFAEALKTALENSGFATVDEAKELLERLGDEEALKAACKGFFEKYELYKHKAAETDAKKFENYTADSLALAERAKLEAQSNRDSVNRVIAACETELIRLNELRQKYLAFEKDLCEKQAQRKLCDELRSLLKSNKFLEFIASEYLQEICLQASKTLLSLTSGKYFLKYDKEFKIGDNLNGGNLRAVKTLSGGETFLVSLALALSLSAEICKKSLRPIEFFFLDEGFGTLDTKLVDTVMDVLGKLSKSFSVGLISHVEELKHRIGNKILVTGADERQGSKLRLESY